MLEQRKSDNLGRLHENEKSLHTAQDYASAAYSEKSKREQIQV